MVPRAMEPTRFSSLCSSDLRHFDHAERGGDLGLGHEHLGDEDGSGRGHDDGGEEVLRVDAEEDVGGHDAAGDVRHAGGHDGHELGARGVAEEWADGERGFGLAHEDAGGDVGGLRAGGAHGALHEPGDDLDDVLHDAEVIEHREERGDKDDRGQDGEGEDGERAVRVAELGPKTRMEPSAAWPSMAVTWSADRLEDLLAEGPLNDEEGEEDLEAETPDDRAPPDRVAVSGERVSNAEKNSKSEQSGESAQRGCSCMTEKMSQCNGL